MNRWTADRMDFSGPCGRLDDPAAHIRAALLTIAMMIATILSALLTTVPRTLHEVGLVLPNADEFDQSVDGVPRPVYRADILANGDVTFDGVRCNDLLELLQALEVVSQRIPEPQIRLRVHPDLQYEQFLETLVVFNRARVTWLRLELDALMPEMTESAGVAKEPHAAPVWRASFTWVPDQEASLPRPSPTGCARLDWQSWSF